MEFLELAQELKVAKLGFGCCPLGGHDWGTVDQEEILRAANGALDIGINLFDTADIYGLGKSESALANLAKTRRSEMVLATKFGVRRFDNETRYDNCPAWIFEACEQSLKRLNVETIDIYQVHYWDEKTDWEVIFDSLQKLKEAGKLRFVGISNVPESLMSWPKLPDYVVAFQMQFSVLDQNFEPVINSIQGKWGLSFWSWGSLAQGLLSGKYGAGTKFDSNDRRSRLVYENFHDKKLETNQEVIEIVRDIAARHQRTPAQVALRYVIQYFPMSLPLVGIKSTNQLQENAGIFGWSLTDQEMSQLQSHANPTQLRKLLEF